MAMKGTGFPWNDERDAELKQYLEQRLSYEQIAGRMMRHGRCTENVVSKRVRVLGIRVGTGIHKKSNKKKDDKKPINGNGDVFTDRQLFGMIVEKTDKLKRRREMVRKSGGLSRCAWHGCVRLSTQLFCEDHRGSVLR